MKGADMTPQNNGTKGDKIIVHVDEDLEDLIPGFLNNRRKDIDTMRSALKEGDFETIRSLGHSMKGAGGGYGFDLITDIGRDLEISARDGDVEKINQKVDALARFLESVEVVYEPE